MEQVITTIQFNGQFWIAIIEKIDNNGVIHIGKYTFGPEPNNNHLLEFYLNYYIDVHCLESSIQVRKKQRKCIKEQIRTTSKSYDAIKKLLEESSLEKSKETKLQKKVIMKEQFRKKMIKKKEKQHGH